MAVTYEIPRGTTPTTCRGCKAPIYFVKSRATGRPTPVNPDGTSHFTTCPNASDFRKPRQRQVEENQPPKTINREMVLEKSMNRALGELTVFKDTGDLQCVDTAMDFLKTALFGAEGDEVRAETKPQQQDMVDG